MNLLLDAGVWLAARDRDDPFHEASRDLIGSDSAELHALDLTLYEVANVATVRWRSRTEANRLVDLVMAACERELVRVDASLIDTSTAIATRHGISVYDAAYVSCAERLDLELVSTDLRDLVRVGLARSPAKTRGD